ncbi:GNAT family N-acetyltransferase [Alkalicoccus daliensis]|uniref:Acetyltransferase (GNAT) family protein n=1 Tax=Alkalicoccus daliensis TaxID=745820 RepID=A0A1G9ZAE8_9BACI|nr:GNAT family N-acetyltransferase [Alkalicoccus daliensis]SDN18442.1 Acetyltransferase (GNAT) family protein [Alkalicoccus daliensis]
MKIYKVEKPGTKEEIANIAGLMMEQMEQLSNVPTPEKLEETIALALQEECASEFFVAERNNEVIGCAFLNKGVALDKGGYYIWLNDLYVKKAERKQGIAKKLLLHVLQWAENEGLKGIELETGMNNEATKRLYNALGFYDIISKRYGRTL